MIVTFQNIQKYYGANLVLSDTTFEIRDGERVGLIGRNGAGKTTVFKLITGLEKPDGGLLTIRRGTTIGCLEQIPDYKDATTVYDVLARGYREVQQWQAQMVQLEGEMADPAVCADERQLQRILDRYERLRESFERAGGYAMENTIDRVAAGLGVAKDQYERPFASLSGGEKTKVGLCSLLIEQPQLLLLDEPTNHLDMQAIEWLESYLTDYAGTVVVISHDRYFLDKVVNKIVEVEDGEAIKFHTNYSGYQQEKHELLMKQFHDYTEQQKKIKKMQEAIKQLIEFAHRGNPPNEKFYRRAASMQKALDRIERIKRPILERKAIDLQLEQNERSGKQVAVFEDVTKGFGTRCLFTGLSEQLTYGERVFLIGENGAGKSTLFKLLLGDLTPDAGAVKLGSRVEVGYLAQEEAPHEEGKTVLQWFREEVRLEEGRARKELTRFLFFGSDVFKAVKSLSGGEWTRLRLALIMYRKPNLLLLDEPTNHLDIDSREALEEALEEFDGTILCISHDRYFINKLAQKIWELEAGELTRYLGDFSYFREKKAEAQALPRVEQPPIQPVEVPQPRAVVAETPPEPRKKVNPFQKAKLEAHIAALEATLTRLDNSLVDPTNGTDAGKLATLYAERGQVQAELDEQLEQWMALED